MALDLESILGAYRKSYDAKRNTNFRHVTRNLLCVAALCDQTGLREERDRIIGVCRRYIALLDEFSELRERDLHALTQDCYGAERYVEQQWRWLKGGAPDAAEKHPA